MSTVKKLAPIFRSSTWAEICALYPNEWVCLLDLDLAHDGPIHSARVVSHDPSIERAIDLVDPPDPNVTVVHTAGRPLWTPRIEILDESRDTVRTRR